MQTQESPTISKTPCGCVEFDFTHFDDDAFDDSGAQEHVVEPAGRFEIATPGSSKRLPWRVVFRPDPNNYIRTEERWDRSGNRVIGYGSRDAARRVADRLNAELLAGAR